jgi:hypothetical protein
MDCQSSQEGEVSRMKKIIIALSLLLALSAMAGCYVHRDHDSWNGRVWEWHGQPPM